MKVISFCSQAFFVIFLAFFGLVGCDANDKVATGPQASQLEVGTITVTPQRVVYTTELPGRTTPFQVAEVRPQVSGIVQSRLFREGTDVMQDDVLYQIDPAIYQAAYDSAKASLAKAQANIEPHRLKYNRFKDLVAVSAVSRQEFEDAEATYKQALADVQVSKAALENARIRLDYTKVTASISGRIGKSNVTPGALVTENQATNLATIQQLNPMYVDMTQSSAELLRLKKAFESGSLQKDGSQQAVVKLRLEDGSEYDRTGTLEFTDVSVDPSTSMVTLRAVFPNPRFDLLPNLYVRAEVTEGVDENAVLIPQRAVVRDSKGDPLVYVVENGTVASRSITTPRSHGNNWVVTKGLASGDVVIVDNLQRIRPGIPVKALPAKAS